MSLSGTLLITALMTCAAITACDAGASGDVSSSEINDSFRYAVPQFESGAPPPDQTAPPKLTVDADGSLALDGKPYQLSELVALPYFTGGADLPDVVVAPAKNATFATIVANLPEIAALGAIELREEVPLEPFTSATQANDRLPAFQGSAGDWEVPIVVGYTPTDDQCLAALDGDVVTGDELYDKSFEWLDLLVVRGGGAEAVLARPDLLDGIVAKVQAKPDTPWRCIGGAVRRVSLSGWPFVSLEVTGD